MLNSILAEVVEPAVSTALLQWLQILLSVISLVVIFYGVFKVVNRNNEEWRDRERRITAIEAELAEMRKESTAIIALGVQFTALSSQFSTLVEEMKRIRDRLDTFLDKGK